MKKRSDAVREMATKQTKLDLPIWRVNMNEEQLAAILHDEGPVRVLAGAGSGKTRALVHRIVRLVESGVAPERICAVTFGAKAAEEMNKRLDGLGLYGARVGTWHSLAIQILREDRTRWADYKVDDTNRAKFLMKDVVGWKGMNWKGADVSALMRFVAHCKANVFFPDSPEAADVAKEKFGWQANLALRAYQGLQDALDEKGLITFDDFLMFAVAHLSENEDRRAMWAARFDHLLNDEVQDNNRAQEMFVELLARDHRNYMAIGDLFQAIYGFRGSSPLFLANFEKTWEGARTITLPRNYRSGRAIVRAANGIVAKGRVGDEEPLVLVAERDFEGSAVARAHATLDDEAAGFVGWVRDLVAGGASYGDVTALFRTNAQSRALEEALLKERVPYVVVGGTSFYERKEVRDLLAYLRVATGRGEVEDIKRCINAPFRFLGAKFVEKLMEAAGAEADDHGAGASGIRGGSLDWASLVDDFAESDGYRLQDRQRASAKEWASMIRAINEKVAAGQKRRAELEAAGEPTAIAEEHEDEGDGIARVRTTEPALLAARPASILEDIIRATRYIDWLTKEEGEDSIEQSGAANVREMVRVAERFPTAFELLDYIDKTIRAARKQRQDKQAGGERVLLMSVHRSKGLEWPHVWVAGFNEQILPHAKGDIEEERRLAYVAVTRARDSVVLSYVLSLATRAGVRGALPSRFLVDSGVRLDGAPESPTRVGEDRPQSRSFSAFEERHRRCSMYGVTKVYKHDPDCEYQDEHVDISVPAAEAETLAAEER